MNKVVVNNNGGTATVSSFTLKIDGGTVTSGVANGVTVGAHVVSETPVAGYTGAITGDCDSLGNVTLALGENKTCTITNDDIGPTLTVIKHVVNDNGGTSLAGAFTMTVDDPGTDPPSFAGAESPGTTVTVDAGAYTVTETGPAGYSASASADCTGSIAVGETKTCTITNDDIGPTLTVIKHVVNDNGGTSLAGAFTMTVDDPGTDPPSFAGAESPGTTVTVDAGAYTVTETGPAGYSASASADCTGSIAVGETKTCTITNDDIGPSLTLVKTVVNDNGGTALATAFTLTATGPTTISGAGGATSNGSFDQGTYALSETSLAGYTASAWVCTGSGTQSGSNITVGLGQSATCTITNNDNPPSTGTLTVFKQVTNNNGGTATPGSFSIHVKAGLTDVAGSPQAGSSLGTMYTLSAGTYVVSEDANPGYTGAITGACTTGGSVTVAAGDAKICTITNDDNAQPPGPLNGIVKSVNGQMPAPGQSSFNANLWLCVDQATDGIDNNGDSQVDNELPTCAGAGEGSLDIKELLFTSADCDTRNDDDDNDGKPVDGSVADGSTTAYVGSSPRPECYQPTLQDYNLDLVDEDGGELPEGLGAFEFQIKFDHKLFDISVTQNAANWLTAGRTANCSMQIISENDIRYGCISTGTALGFSKVLKVIAASVTITPDADMGLRIRPTKDNGVAAYILDENCEIADIYGDIFPDTNAGLTQDCTDVGVTIRRLEGDMNGDCNVNLEDQQLTAFRYGSFFGNLTYSQFYDVQPWPAGDFDIDIKDLQFVFGRDGSSCATPIPDNQDPVTPDGINQP